MERELAVTQELMGVGFSLEQARLFIDFVYHRKQPDFNADSWYGRFLKAGYSELHARAITTVLAQA